MTPRTRRDADVVGRGPRLLLRYARPTDRAAFLALHRASRAFLAPWGPRITDSSGRKRFERLLAGRSDPAQHRLLIVARDDGRLLGCFSVSNVVRGVFQNATLGCWIGAAHARQGYMTEASHAALAFAFRRLRLHRLEANLVSANRASRALARRMGFRREGLSPRMLKIAGRWQDCERWALLADEWRVRVRTEGGAGGAQR